jgi:hydroxymethylpyrimidine/phosphomethylpyrimidine kinase
MMAEVNNQTDLKTSAMQSVDGASIITSVTIKNLHKPSWRDPNDRNLILLSGSFFLFFS